jgi:hypothetical protein
VTGTPKGSLAGASTDLRGLLSPDVPIQGPRPLCLPFAVGAGHEAALAPRANLITALAPEALWWRCTHLGQTSASGVRFRDLGTALVDSGQPDLSEWPYNPMLGAGTEEPPPSLAPPPWKTAIIRDVVLAHDRQEGEIEAYLAAGSPVVVVIELTQEFDVPGVGGLIAIPGIRAPAGDYHAVLIVGAATHPTEGRCFLIRNSWGPGWGAGGYAWLPVGYLEGFATQAGVVTVP